MDAPLAGSSVAEALGNAFRLSTDRQRHGQDAFTASPFSRLLITQVLSLGGDALVTLALAGSIFFNTNLHAARGRVTLTLLLTMAPFAVVAPLLGPIIDRTKGGRRMMVLATALGRAVACFLMARYINHLLLFPAAFLTLVCSKGYTVAKATLVPSAVQRPEDLVEANSKLAVSGAIAGFLMAVPGVAILKLAGAAWVLRVDILVFLACAASALRLQAPNPSQQRVTIAADASRSGAPTRPLPDGAIQVSAFAMGTLRSVVGFLTFLVAFGFRKDHAPAWWYGVVLACSIGGNLVGAAIAPWLRSRVREEPILAASSVTVAVAGVMAMFFSAVHSRPAASLLATVVGLGAGAAKLAFDALVQRHVPAASQGRAFGRFEAGFQLVWVLGALAPVVIPLSLRAGFLVIASATAVASSVYLAGFRMARLGQLPTWWPGVTRPGDTRRQRPPTSRPATTRGATVPFPVRGSPARAAGPTVPLGTTPWASPPGSVDDVPPWVDPPAEPGADRASGVRDLQVTPRFDPPPDLGTYPPSIGGPPPFGRSGRPVPPPLAGPPPLAAPLTPRPRRDLGGEPSSAVPEE